MTKQKRGRPSKKVFLIGHVRLMEGRDNRDPKGRVKNYWISYLKEDTAKSFLDRPQPRPWREIYREPIYVCKSSYEDYTSGKKTISELPETIAVSDAITKKMIKTGQGRIRQSKLRERKAKKG